MKIKSKSLKDLQNFQLPVTQLISIKAGHVEIATEKIEVVM